MSEENIYIQKKNKWITKKNSNVKKILHLQVIGLL